ncbi:50S ribosomal protein L29 [Deinococcus wulumuqiensis]|uniref:Large ribosomal subunit protein uL29 n=1 Tax=Deinococcus wulumuqiensis TaxID=980427 RepID=A0A345IJH5_9DEIO|nr:50S ribosomal protein L29 [Deinococcus wulumuqiensis]AXG99847.1 50S ribosomal protein L29 [Deinococcus wulumuqiensis]QII21056.1 50S ribosomal protein L29 [Deinococcus wulumuqiensis R12]GGI68130.1 50S ribosomal protein L29 [Deinococcus wulumuqiensis]
MKPSEMRNLQADDFAKEIDSRKKELMELRFQAAAGQLAQPHRVRQLRREVAQLNTVKAELARKGEQQ